MTDSVFLNPVTLLVYPLNTGQLTTVRGYSHQLHALLEGLRQASPGAPPLDLGYLKGVADVLDDGVKKLETLEKDFQADCEGRTDAKGRPKISKIKWARLQGKVNQPRRQVWQWKQDLAHAVPLFQTTQM